MNKKIYTVSRLNQEVQALLESGFGTLWLQGEISNFSRPGSGHFYFSLKDSQSQIRCAMFRGKNRYLGFQPGNGDAVVVRGKVSLYTARGDFQLIVEHMEPAGEGKLQAAFEKTKQELDALGWFAQELKKPIPELPRTVGVITSPTSAALRDVLQVLRRRYCQAQVVIYPTATQGANAAPAIVKALTSANYRQECDVILLVRGGGSLEDLWPFNELAVATAIKQSDIPIVTGIGHEIDFTISDLVGDLRAPTPSAAAELATPDNSRLQNQLDHYVQRLSRLSGQSVGDRSDKLNQLITRLMLRHPDRQLAEKWQRLDGAGERLKRANQLVMKSKANRYQTLSLKLASHTPDQKIIATRQTLTLLESRLRMNILKQNETSRQHLHGLMRTLHSVSPLAVLERGYSIVRKDEKLITNVGSVMPGDTIRATLAQGEFEAIVSAIMPDKPKYTT